MKVFISHKEEDAHIATVIAEELYRLKVTSYLDILDDISENGKALTEHIKRNLNRCSDIIVVMSYNTYRSQWVPFEVGMAAQQDMPTATYLENDVKLPDFLEYWPRMKTLNDIKKYVDTKKQVDQLYENRRYGALFDSSENKKMSKTERFYKELKAKLL